MTPDEFSQALKALSWKQSDFARMTDINQTTVSRWMTESNPVPRWAASHIRLLLDIQGLADKHLNHKKD